MSTVVPRELLLESFRAAVGAADPRLILTPHLPTPPRHGRTFVLAVGKAAASMAQALEAQWPESASLDGIALTRYRHGLPTRRIRVIEAGHPVPDEAGESAAREALARVRELGVGDLFVALISGGGSSLLALPAAGITMSDLRAVTSQLLRSGATIQEINTVRKHLSAIQGGQLAVACRAQVVALIISDVTGDDPTHIASGPCTPDPTTYRDALAVLARHAVVPPPLVRDRLDAGMRGVLQETPKPGDNAFARVENRVIATAQRSLDAAAGLLRARGIAVDVLGDNIIGEAAEVAKRHAELVRDVRKTRKGLRAILSGGECTVTVGSAQGRGGRCAEYLLALAVDLEDAGVHAIAADTDGIDGTEDNAGAILAPDTVVRSRAKGLDPVALLNRHDSYGYFAALGDLVVTGPTLTNVNDYRAILIDAA